ncbi:hypothetical protein GIB67_003907, partial [Kingdonia uniflora]
NNSSSNASSKKKKGLTRGSKPLPNGKKKNIRVNSWGQPNQANPETNTYSSDIGFQVRMHLLIIYESFKDVHNDRIALVECYDISHVSWLDLKEKIRDVWKMYKYRLNTTLIVGNNPGDVKAYPAPEFVPREDWVKFVDYCNSEKFMAKSKRNKENRAKLIASCTLGRTSMPITRHKLAEERGVTNEEIGRVEVSIPTHTKKDKIIQCPDVIAELQNTMRKDPKSIRTGPNDAIAQVFNVIELIIEIYYYLSIYSYIHIYAEIWQREERWNSGYGCGHEHILGGKSWSIVNENEELRSNNNELKFATEKLRKDLDALPKYVGNILRLKRNTLFVDVLSVKEFPRSLFFRILPKDFDVLCTHPMFGPESGRNGWNGLPFVYDKVRIGRDESRVNRCERFLNIFVQEGCRMEETSCKEHDKNAAESQFITHTVGRLEILDMAFEALKKELFEHENKDFGVTKEKPMLPLLLENGKSPPPILELLLLFQSTLVLPAVRSLFLSCCCSNQTCCCLLLATKLLLAAVRSLLLATEILLAVTTELLLASTAAATTLGKLFTEAKWEILLRSSSSRSSDAMDSCYRYEKKVISPTDNLPSQQAAYHRNEKHQHIDKECRLVGCPWRIVAHGVIVGVDPTDMCHSVALGDDFYKVAIHDIVDGNALLFRPNSNIKRLLDVGIGSFVAWPKSMITF